MFDKLVSWVTSWSQGTWAFALRSVLIGLVSLVLLGLIVLGALALTFGAATVATWVHDVWVYFTGKPA